MTDEGTFPKIDGDILYGSEVNKFNNAGEFLKIGSTLSVGSATIIQTAGSVLIPAGSLSNPCHLQINFLNNIGASAITQNIIGVSGTSGSITLSAGSNIGRDFRFGRANIFIGSPMSGCGALQVQGGDIQFDVVNGGIFQVDGDLASNIDPSEPLVIFFNLKAVETERYEYYSIHAIGGTS